MPKASGSAALLRQFKGKQSKIRTLPPGLCAFNVFLVSLLMSGLFFFLFQKEPAEYDSSTSHSTINSTLSESLSRDSTPGPSHINSAPVKKRKHHHPSQPRSPRKRGPKLTAVENVSLESDPHQPVISQSVSATQQRRQQNAANWASVLQSLVYPLMDLTPALCTLGPREVLWKHHGHKIRCIAGCDVKESVVNVISFGGKS